MKRITLSLLIVSAVLFTGAFAQTAEHQYIMGNQSTRALTMGENNMILHDESNIWLFPSRIYEYPDLVVAELGYGERYLPGETEGVTGDMARLGVNWKFGQDNPFVLGTYLHNDVPLIPLFTPIDPPWHGTYPDSSLSNKRVDLFYGNALGKNNFGVHFGMVHSSAYEEGLADLDKTSLSQYNIDLGLTMKEGTFDIAAGLEFFSFSDKNDEYYPPDSAYIAVDNYKSDGSAAYYLRGRYFWDYNPTYSIVPHAEFRYGKWEWEEYDWIVDIPYDYYQNERDYTQKYTMTTFDIGNGLHYTPTTSVLAVIDIGMLYAKIKSERAYDTTGNSVYTHEIPDPENPGETIVVKTDTTFESSSSYFVLPYIKIGFEASAFKWMDIRLGATSYWTKHTDEDNEGDKYTEKYPYNETYLGLGFHWGRLFVDCYTDPELFLNGFDFLTGSETERMNFQMTVTYEMF